MTFWTLRVRGYADQNENGTRCRRLGDPIGPDSSVAWAAKPVVQRGRPWGCWLQQAAQRAARCFGGQVETGTEMRWSLCGPGVAA